jgi:predicted nucleic acid-binding protein
VLLLDNSAWTRIVNGALDHERAETVAGWIEQRYLGTCLPFVLEAGYSARSGVERSSMMADLDRLPRIEIDRDVEKLTLDAQQELAEIGHHRLAPADVMIAACAHKAEAGVLHYDGDYDILAEKTSLLFDSEWLAPRGSLSA